MLKILKISMLVALSAQVGFMTSLKSSQQTVLDETPESFQSCPVTPKMDFFHKGLTDEHLEALSANSGVTTLTHLDLSDNPALTADGLGYLREVTALKILYLGGNERGDRDVYELNQGSYRLEDLDLARNNLTGAGIDALATGPHCTSLTRLSLDENNLDDGGIQSLSNLTNLQDLNLNANNLTNEVQPTIVPLTNLTVLQVVANNISNPNLFNQLSNLTVLEMEGNPLSDD